MLAVRLAAATLGVVLLAGCTAIPAVESVETTAADAEPDLRTFSDAGILEWCPAAEPERYDPDEVPIDEIDAVAWCTLESWNWIPEQPPQKLERAYLIDRRDIPAVLSAFAADDEPPLDALGSDDDGPTLVCSLKGYRPLVVWLHVGQRILPVVAPRAACGAPQDDAREAVAEADRDLVFAALVTLPENTDPKEK
jgi:hypothetical protein